jgi:hypothetical protein
LKVSTEHRSRSLNSSASNDRFLVCVRIEVVGLEWLATPLAITVHLGHQRHDRARDIPIVLAFGLSHQHKLAKR